MDTGQSSPLQNKKDLHLSIHKMFDTWGVYNGHPASFIKSPKIALKSIDIFCECMHLLMIFPLLFDTRFHVLLEYFVTLKMYLPQKLSPHYNLFVGSHTNLMPCLSWAYISCFYCSSVALCHSWIGCLAYLEKWKLLPGMVICL